MPNAHLTYPPNWDRLRALVRERSQGRCEWPLAGGGRCMVRNGHWYHRLITDPEQTFICAADGPDCTERDVDELAALHEAFTPRPVRIVLTTAHTCQDSTCDRLDHLAHWCQWHHLRYDAAQHGRNAAETRRRKRIEQGQQPLAIE